MTSYTSGQLKSNNNISSLYDRSLDVYGIRLVASGAVGGAQAVPDAWVYKTARVVQLLLDKNAVGINQAAQERFIKNLSGSEGMPLAGFPVAQRIGYGGKENYSPNPMSDEGKYQWEGLPKFLNSYTVNDMVWYRMSGLPSPPKGKDDIGELTEHLLHTFQKEALRGAVEGSYDALDTNNTNSELYDAMREAVSTGAFGLEGYGGSLDNDADFTKEVTVKEYLYLLTFGMWDYSEYWKGGSLAPEWSDSARTPDGVLASNPLGYKLFNDYIAPVLSKPEKATLKTMFQDNDQGAHGYVWDTSETSVIDIIVDQGILSGPAQMLKSLSKKILKNGETVLNQTIEYGGTEFAYDQIASFITIVTDNGVFTDNFRSEIKDSFPQHGAITYQEAVSLVGVANIDGVLVSVAGADGAYVQ